ncbi:MAG TPA: PIN domain-containing protein [Kiritimatiellia bacterium]|jgi:predicted nucleic acid-binding protein|nr:PIN domain-containing protein [Kiritimatiellia bacterium]
MILVDTSVWVDHLRNGNDALSERLLKNEVSCHPMIIGELACGNLKRRKEILALLHALPTVGRVSDDEILFFIEQHRLSGRGLGLVDIHILASCVISRTPLWTMDGRLRQAANELADN